MKHGVVMHAFACRRWCLVYELVKRLIEALLRRFGRSFVLIPNYAISLRCLHTIHCSAKC